MPATRRSTRMSRSALSSAPPGNTCAPARNAALFVRCRRKASGPRLPSRNSSSVAAGCGASLSEAIAFEACLGRPAGAVLVVLRLDEIARLLPVGVGHLVELGEIRAGGEIARAVDGDGFAGQPLAAVGHEEGGEVLQ